MKVPVSTKTLKWNIAAISAKTSVASGPSPPPDLAVLNVKTSVDEAFVTGRGAVGDDAMVIMSR